MHIKCLTIQRSMSANIAAMLLVTLSYKSGHKPPVVTVVDNYSGQLPQDHITITETDSTYTPLKPATNSTIESKMSKKGHWYFLIRAWDFADPKPNEATEKLDLMIK